MRNLPSSALAQSSSCFLSLALGTAVCLIRSVRAAMVKGFDGYCRSTYEKEKKKKSVTQWYKHRELHLDLTSAHTQRQGGNRRRGTALMFHASTAPPPFCRSVYLFNTCCLFPSYLSPPLTCYCHCLFSLRPSSFTLSPFPIVRLLTMKEIMR